MLSSLILGNSVSAAETAITPAAVDMNGYEYVHSSGTKNNKTIDWTHIHTNPSGVTATVTRSVERSLYSTATVSAESSFKMMEQKVGVTAELSLGGSSTRTTSVSWNLPANSTYQLRFGSYYGTASGKENYWVNGKIKSTKSVTGKWTHGSFSDSVKQ